LLRFKSANNTPDVISYTRFKAMNSYSNPLYTLCFKSTNNISDGIFSPRFKSKNNIPDIIFLMHFKAINRDEANNGEVATEGEVSEASGQRTEVKSQKRENRGQGVHSCMTAKTKVNQGQSGATIS
jgi:hypothetical protein